MKYGEKCYNHKFDNLGEINFLKTHKLSKFNQDKMDNLK